MPQNTPDLDDALADLAGIGDEARDEGFKPPPEAVVLNAAQLLRSMYAHRPRRFEVYPTPEGGAAVYAGKQKRSVLVLCDPDGSVHCSVNLDGRHCRAYYDRTFQGGIPTGFLQEALAAIA